MEGLVMLYTINACSFNDVQKVFNRYAKKATSVGLECSLNVVNTYIKEVTTYAVDPVTHEMYKTGIVPIDVMDIELVYPEYRLGNYTVVAVIEHGENNTNLVYPCGDYTVPNKYFTSKAVCEHCGTNHKRVKTVLLQDVDTNTLKQVGTGCLKEYTGVTDTSLVNAYRALDSIIENNLSDRGFVGEPANKYVDTKEYLAKCIHVYNQSGYTKDNKYLATKISEIDLTDVELTTADTVINFFVNANPDDFDNFLNNIKNTLANAYCKRDNGFVAYAYVAYLKEMEKLEKINARNAEMANLSYYGQVGDKIKDIQVTGRCCASYDGMYGHTYIYKFQDKEGHIFTWKTSSSIDRNDDGVFTGTISGTVKAHNEYNGEKQTVLTRCKVVYTEPTEESECTKDIPEDICISG